MTFDVRVRRSRHGDTATRDAADWDSADGRRRRALPSVVAFAYFVSVLSLALFCRFLRLFIQNLRQKLCARAPRSRVYTRELNRPCHGPCAPHTVASHLPSPRGGGHDATAHGRGAGAFFPQAPAHRRPYGLGFDEGHASVEHDLPAGAAPRRGVGGRHEPCAHAGLEVSRQPRCLRRACPVWQGAMAGHLRRDASCSYWYAQLVQVASEQAHDGSALGGLARRRLAQLGRKPQGLESRPRVGVARASSSRLRRRR